MNASRFAPSTTGDAHPGTLLAGLLAWLDARKHGRRLILRLEDLDPERSSSEKVQRLQEQLAWFGLDFDTVEVQSQNIERHRAARNQLIAQGRIYACACSRREVQALNPPHAADGGLVYPGTCKNRGLALDGGLPLRLCLNPGVIQAPFVGIHNPAQDPASAMGDPVVWRRDGVPAYHLASVADDIASGVDSIVRGVDLLHSTGIQAQLFQFLGAQVPCYRHHLLLLEREKNSEKFSKFHQSVAVPELQKNYSPQELCGILAQAAGIIEHSTPCSPQDLLANFSWDKVRTHNVLLNWNGKELHA